MSIAIAGKQYPLSTTELVLTKNRITCLPSFIKKLTNLTYLNISFNNLKQLPEYVLPLSITYLDINNNRLTVLPNFIGQFIHLKFLNISFNHLTCLPNSIKYLTNLTILCISHNKLKKCLPDSIVQLIKLTHLDVEHNRLKQLPNSIGHLTNLTYLGIKHNQLTQLPNSIGQLNKLTSFNTEYNRLTCLPNSIGKLTNLTRLEIGFNYLKCLPNSIEHLVNLNYLHINDNELRYLPNSIGKLTNLRNLGVHDNNLTYLPHSIGQLTNLTQLYINRNQLTHLPIQLINLRHCYFYHNGNPIEYIPPPLRRFLNRQRNITTGVYNDTQNVHDHNIQESIKNSIFNIMNDKLKIDNDTVNQQIVEDTVLETTTKQQLQEYITDGQVHSNYQITFQELLTNVWQRITDHKDSNEIKKIMNIEMQDGLCMCFTGRLSRLVNCLNGFFDDIKIKIHDNQQIGNIILLIKNKLETDEGIDIEQWKSEVMKELKEREYKTEEIQEWLEYID
jgi:Leucine-rich repeat (LRR) protein